MCFVVQVADRKGPLKGKGRELAQWSADAQAQLAAVHGAMDELAAESRSISQRAFGLHIYTRRTERQLRWRLIDGSHLAWPRIEGLLAQEPQGLARWYRAAIDRAHLLNHREQALRYEVKTAQRAMAGAQRYAAAPLTLERRARSAAAAR
jgi:hypothetical protein